MTPIDPNQILLLVATAVVGGISVFSKDIYTWAKNRIKENRQISKSKEKNENYLKLKTRIFIEEIEELNVQENMYQQREHERILANNMAMLKNQTECNRIITSVLLKEDVKRFIVFHTHNGNGQPSNLKPFKVSYLQYNAVDISEIKNYQNLEVDANYAQMLIDIQNSENHSVCLKVDEMEDCLLKSIYKKEKMKYVEIYFLCATNTGIIYTSLATNKDNERFEDCRLDIHLAVNHLKHIFTTEVSRVFRDGIEREENETRLKEIYLRKKMLKDNLEKL
jgi:hypothetical protein